MVRRKPGVPVGRIVFLSLAGFALLFCALAAFAYIRFTFFLKQVAPNADIRQILGIVEQPHTAEAAQHLGRVNFLLLGYGGAGHDGAYLTDSIMVVSAQTDTHQLAMISIPRDLWISIPTNRYGLYWTTKINGAYTIGVDDSTFPYKDARFSGLLGGGNLSSEMVHRVTGLPIQYWIAVDFDGFRKVVDSVGGVDLNVPQVLDDPYYPAGETTGYMHIHFNAGWQHMNGEQALEYARSRETTSDFDRSRRQQQILLAVRRKVLSIDGIPKLFGLMGALQAHVRTNMDLATLRRFADTVSRLEDTHAARVSIDNTNFLYTAHSEDGQYILLPYDVAFAGLKHYLDQVFADPEVPVEGAAVQFVNGTDNYGLASRSMADLLTQLWSWAGVKTIAPADAARRAYVQSEVHDYSNGTAPDTVAFLAAFFNARVITEAGPSPSGAGLVVIVGSTFARSFIPYLPPPPPPAETPTPGPTASATPRPIGP